MGRSWSFLVLVSLGIGAVLLLAGYEVAGSLGLLATAAYLGCILAPGVALFGTLAARFRPGPSCLLEVVFYSNVLGLTLTEGVGWLLTRSGAFSLFNLLTLETCVIAVLLALFGRTIVRRVRQGPGTLLTAPSEEVALLGIVAAVSVLVMLPVLVLSGQGFLLGVDTPIYTRVGAAVSATGSWPSLSQVWYPGASSAGLAPGMPMVYAVFSAVTGIVAVPLAASIALLPIILTPLGLCLLLRRFSRLPVVTYGLPLVWLVAQGGFSGFLYNTIFSSAFIGAHPDAGVSLPAFVAVLILFVDLSRGKSAQWFEVGLLSAAVAGGILSNQLTFIFIALAFILFGIPILWSRGVRWCLPRLAAVLVPTLVAFPPYLIPSVGLSASPGLSTHSIWQLSEWQVKWSFLAANTGLFAVFSVALGVVALAALTYEWRKRRAIGSAVSSTKGLPAMVLLCGIGLYLAFSNVGSDLLNVAFSRFVEYASLAALPLFAFGFDRFLQFLPAPKTRTEPIVMVLSKRGRLQIPHRRWWLVGRVLSTLAVVALFVSAGVLGVVANFQAQSAVDGPAGLASPNILAAGAWLKSHAAGNALVAVDANGGNNIAVSPLLAYSGHTTVIRARDDLYQQLNQPAPANLTYYYMNLVMTDPTEANAAAAAGSVGIDYYVFEAGFSNRQIAVFSLLPYFSLVYSNSQVYVFEFVGGTEIGFIPAVSYCALSNAMTVGQTARAYSFAFSIPKVPTGPNMILSTVPNPNGTQFASYCLDIPWAGSYTLYIHRYMYQKSEFINVSTGERSLGQAYFLSLGLDLGTPVPLTLPAGPITLTLTFDGTKGFVDWVDYLVLAPA